MKLFFFLLLFSHYSDLHAQSVRAFFVSPEGNDSARGTSLETAFATIDRARLAVRDVSMSGTSRKPVNVYIRGGTYQLQSPVVFTHDDSGTEQAPVHYQAYQNEKPVISGGRTISGWKKYKNEIWMAKVPGVIEGRWKFRQLFVNGEKRSRARFPNQGFFRVKGFPDGGAEVHYHTDCQRFEYAAGDLNANWKNLEDAEVIVYHFWTDSHLPIGSIDPKTRIVTFRHKAGKRFTDDFSKKGARYIVENVWEGLDAPGEWYLDKKAGILYYYPKPGEDMKQVKVTVPFAPELLRMEGNPEDLKPVSYLAFTGLTFEYTNWDLPSGNSNDNQGSSSVPAAITLKGASHISFDSCTVQNTGTFGFEIIGGSQHNSISHCNLNNLGAGGIRINGGKEDEHPLLFTGYNRFTDNYLHHYGREFPSACGVLIMHSGHNEISHNEIHHGYYTGVSVGMVWGYRRSVATHNLITYNHIHDIGMDGLLSDMGGIYTLGVSSGTMLLNNIIHDVNANHYGGWGIYLDEGSSHLLVKNNIVYNTKFAPFNIHFSKEVLVQNNIFAFGKLEQVSRQRVEPHKSVFFERNLIYWKEGSLLVKDWRDTPYSFHMGANQKVQEVRSTFDMDYNLYFNPTSSLDSTRFNGLSWTEWRKTGKDGHSVFSDPLFIDADKYDFRLRPGSPAFKLGFQQIQTQFVGARR